MTLLIEPQDFGLTTGVLGSLRALGGAIAQSLYVSILSNELKKNIPKYVAEAAMAAGLPQSSLPRFLTALSVGLSVERIPGATSSIITAATAALKIAYAQSFRIVFFCTIPFSLILIVSSSFVPNMESFLHYNIAKRLQGEADDASGSKPDIEMVEKAD